MGEDLLSPELQKKYQEAREHYKELLAHAKPFGPEVLTIDRINELNAHNQRLVSTLETILEWFLDPEMPKQFKEKLIGLNIKR